MSSSNKLNIKKDAFKKDSLRTDFNKQLQLELLRMTNLLNNTAHNVPFMGVLTVLANPDPPKSNQRWSASEVGVYTNFGNVEVTSLTGVYNWIVYDFKSDTWSLETIPISSDISLETILIYSIHL